MALESACLPVPSEIVMPFAGYLASTGRFDLTLVATAGAIGCALGSSAIYYVGATAGRGFVEKWGRYIRVTRKDLDRVDHYFARFGAATVFVTRVLPMLPAIISLPAGVARMPFWKFLIYTFVGCWIWCFALAFAGFKFGQAWRTNPWVREAVHSFDLIVCGVIAGGAIWFAWRIWRRYSRTS
jgi:membrane protein DedA with SNARE-associated domain